MSVLSLYIPIIADSISEEYIIKMFKTHLIGKVMKVDFVKNKIKDRREAFIHFDEWFDNEVSKKMKSDILDPTIKTKFKYNGHKYWPLLVNKNAHNRGHNPNYEILDKTEVKNVYKTSLIIPFTNNKEKILKQANKESTEIQEFKESKESKESKEIKENKLKYQKVILKFKEINEAKKEANKEANKEE